MQSETKNCQNCKKDFIIEPDDFSFYEKMKVPAPEKCPDCRQQLRMLYRNFKTLYRRPSSLSGKMIISMYDSDTLFPVYDVHEWWSDDWEGSFYGQEIDWDKTIFEQLDSLFNTVPHICVMNTKSENCEYSNMVISSRNCYLNFGCVENENCDYGHIVWNSRDSIDNLYIYKSEACYECIDCINCNNLLFSQECESCAESIGLFDCKGCVNCIGCVGLINKSYYIFNKPANKQEFDFYLKYNPISDNKNIIKILEEREKLRKEIPQRSFFGFRNNNVSGNHIYNARNVHYSFDVKGGENSKFCFTTRKALDSYDASFNPDISECYQILNCTGSNRVLFSQGVIDSHDAYYSDFCYSCDNIFGCCGLRKKSYCIFNKQYSENEYKEILPKLIEKMKKDKEWGLFLSEKLKVFTYNESIANEYMSLSKEEALSNGFGWKDAIPSISGQETIKIEEISVNPKDL